MMKPVEVNTSSKRELSSAKNSVREKLRAKIRQRIHNPTNEEGDENVNTLNQEKSTRTRHERGKPAPLPVDKVGVSPGSLIYFSAIRDTLLLDGTKCTVEARFNGMPRDQGNWFVLEVLFHTF